MQNDNIKISVIIPAYNVDKYIKKTLRSVISQTLKEIEIICVNDGSTDNTLNIIKNIMLEDKRIILIDKKNGGVSQARNDGIKKARGKYISFIDGDDWIEKNCMEEMYKYAEKLEIDIVACDIYLDYFNKNKKNRYHKEFFSENIITGKEYLELFYNNLCLRSMSNKLIKKSLFIDNKVYFLEYLPSGEDLNMCIKLGYLAKKVGKINKAYYHYIQYIESISKQDTSEKIYPYLISFDDIEEFLKKRSIERYDIDRNKIFRYKITSIQSFPIRQSNWNSKNYIKAVNKYLEIIKDKRLKDNLIYFKIFYKIIWLLIYSFPNINMFKTLNFCFSWLEKLKKKIYIKFYL